VDINWFGCVEVEDQNGRSDGEKAVAQSRDTTDFAAGYRIVVGLHSATIASQVNRVNAQCGLPTAGGNAAHQRVR
jgi:hypothetical protein